MAEGDQLVEVEQNQCDESADNIDLDLEGGSYGSNSSDENISEESSPDISKLKFTNLLYSSR